MPVLQTNAVVYTYADVVEHLLDLHEVDRTATLNQRNARRAILNAYRDLPQKHPWSYYFRQRLLQTAASYSTGTIDYDHTGGVNERQVTLTTGTWPTWAAFGRLIIDGVHYEVDTRVSSTIITLKEDSNPGADVAALTTYQIYRGAYPLPVNFKRMGRIWDIDGGRTLPYVDQQDHHDGAVHFFDTPQTPWQYTLRNNGDYYGSMQLLFGPPPDALLSYDLLYEVTPRPLALDYYATGTIAISGTTVTLTTGTWPSTCVGSILRVSSGASAPTNLIGSLSADNPFVSQHVIKSRTSDTVVVLEESGGTVSSGTGYSVSDPIDIEPGAMLNAFLRMCEAEFCRADNRKDAEARRELAHLAIIEAKEADSRVLPPNGTRVYDYFKHVEVTTDE